MSVGLPVRNGGPLLAPALASLQAQTFGDLEIIVCDNASTDDTAELCRAVAAEDPRVRYIRHPQDIGVVANFNHAARLARGRYFKWAAADDLYAPDFLERCVALLEARPDAVLAHSRAAAIDLDGQPCDAELLPGPGLPRYRYGAYSNLEGAPSVAAGDPVERFRRVMRDLWYTLQLYGVVRREVLSRTALHPPHPMGDHILLSELVLHGPFVEVPEPLFLRRIHPGRITVGRSPRQAVAQALGRREVPRWRVAAAYPERFARHAAAVRRAPLDGRQRAACLGVLAAATLRWAQHRVTGRQR